MTEKSLSDLIGAIEKFAPRRYAGSWDNVGLLVEPPTRQAIGKVLLTIDLTEPVFEEALEIVLDSLIRHRRIPTCDTMASMLEVSRRTLSRALRKEGLTYQHLVERARFDRAREMLADEATSIKEIAFELGFSGANNFGRAFRRLAGVTPSQFRRRAE